MLRYRDFPIIAAVCIAGYFTLLTWPGLTMHFAPDDMQNMYTYWHRGAWGVIQANVLFATAFYRPMAALFYLPLYKLFGLNPLPYRIATLVLLWVNVWLLYCLARRVTRSRETAAFAVLIGCFHPSALAVYVSTAMIYEVLCFLSLTCALLWYVRIRQDGRILNLRDLLVLAGLFICALDSKEMAVVLPAMIAVYEAIYHWPLLDANWRSRWIPVLMTGVMSAIYLAGKLFGKGTLTAIPAYRPEYSVERFLATSSRYAADVLLMEKPLSASGTLLFWLGLFALAAVLRRKNMLFGAAFAFLSYLPLNFVPPRQGFVIYIPLLGFAIYAADLLVLMLDFVRSRLHLSPEYGNQLSALLFFTCMVGSAIWNSQQTENLESMRHAQSVTWHVIEEFQRIRPRVKHGAKLLLVDSPIENSWDMFFIAKLYFDDHDLKAAWVRPKSSDPTIYGDVHDHFDHELRYQGDQLVQAR